jgi:hypothetical protein
VGSPSLVSLTPWSGRGSGAPRILFFVILSPRSDFFGRRPSGSGSLLWAWRLHAIVGASGGPRLRSIAEIAGIGPS